MPFEFGDMIKDFVHIHVWRDGDEEPVTTLQGQRLYKWNDDEFREYCRGRMYDYLEWAKEDPEEFGFTVTKPGEDPHGNRA